MLFSFKAAAGKSFHLFEMNLDGSGLRQLTDSDYDDIDPIYLPDGHLMFTTTRGNTYVRCGPYIYSYTLARCDADGANIYLVSMNSEPDFAPPSCRTAGLFTRGGNTRTKTRTGCRAFGRRGRTEPKRR